MAAGERNFRAGQGASRRDRSTLALIVDDDVSIRRLLEEVLRMRGYRTIATEDGAAVVGRARLERPDVVVLDVGLPGVHGLDVLTQLKADAELSHIPVVLVTGWGEELEERAREAGAHATLGKPFDVHALGDAVDEAVILSRRQWSPSSRRSIPATGIETHSGRLSSS